MDRRAVLMGAGGLVGAAAVAASRVPTGAAPASAVSGPLGIVSVTDHGAVGDGRADDFAAVEAAIAAVASRKVPGGDATGVVWFPPGVYRLTRPLKVQRHVKLVGESMLAAKLVYDGPKGRGPFVTFGEPGQINLNCGLIGLQVNAGGHLPWGVLMYGPQEGSSISGAHVCGGTVGGVDVRSKGIVGGCNKFVVDRGSWIWTEGDGGKYGMHFDEANGPLSIRDVTLVGVNRTRAAPAGSAGLYFNGGFQNVTDVNVEAFESHTSIDGWSNYLGETLSAYGGVQYYILRRSYPGADDSVRFSVQNIDSRSVPVCIRDEHAGITVDSTRSYSNRQIDSSAWNGPHLTLGRYHLWVDSGGQLRINSSVPTSDGDGQPVGGQQA